MFISFISVCKIVEISCLSHFYSGRCISSPRLMYNRSSWAGFEIQQMSKSKSFIRLTWADPRFHLSSLRSLYWSLLGCCIHLQFSFLVFHAYQRPCVYTIHTQGPRIMIQFLISCQDPQNNNNLIVSCLGANYILLN